MSYRRYSVHNTSINLPDARLLSIALIKNEKNWQHILHTHPFTELFFVINGEGRFLSLNHSYHVRAGDFIIAPPYTEHTEQAIHGKSFEYYAIGVDGISFSTANEQPCVQVFFKINNHTLMTELFSQMLYEIRNPAYGSDPICQNLLEILIIRLIRHLHVIPVTYASCHMTNTCARIKEFLDANYSDHITLDTLTELTHMNKYYIAHSFTKYAEQSPMQYLNQRRLEAACVLLKDTDRSVSSISSSVGFSSHSYFTQTFRKKYGMTPLQYHQKYFTPSSVSG